MGKLEKALPPVVRAWSLLDEFLPYQVPKNAVQALLGNSQDAEQLANRHLRMAPDEMNHTVMGAAEAKLRQDGIGLRGEISIGEEQQLDPLLYLVLVQGSRAARQFYVRHIDLSRNL
jgi:hypothetical protein